MIKNNKLKFSFFFLVILLILVLLWYFSIKYNFIEKLEILYNKSVGTIDMDKELKENETLLGLTNVTGEGLFITLEDGNDLIHQEDLIILLDELKNAGSEAICVNDQRITISSYLYCDGGVILVDGKKISSPFTLKAIGNKETLYGALNRNNGYLNTLSKSGISTSLEKIDSIDIAKADTSISSYTHLNNSMDQYMVSNKLIGKKDFKAPGIIITIDTSNTNDITSIHLLQLLNDLNCAGSTAISINDQRIVAMSDIMDVDREYILVNSMTISSPYVIKAIGNNKTMASSLFFENSTLSLLKKNKIPITITSDLNISIPKYSPQRGQDKLTLNYITTKSP